eukprot:2248413-Rhodomonas_salina.1
MASETRSTCALREERRQRGRAAGAGQRHQDLPPPHPRLHPPPSPRLPPWPPQGAARVARA